MHSGPRQPAISGYWVPRRRSDDTARHIARHQPGRTSRAGWLVGHRRDPVGDHPHRGRAAAGREAAAPGGLDRDRHRRAAWFRCAERVRLAGRAGSGRGRRTGLAGHRPSGCGPGHPRPRRARAHACGCGRPAVRVDRLGAARALRAHLRRWTRVPTDDDSAALSHASGPGASRRPRNRRRRPTRCPGAGRGGSGTPSQSSACPTTRHPTRPSRSTRCATSCPASPSTPGSELREPSYRTARQSRRR